MDFVFWVEIDWVGYGPWKRLCWGCTRFLVDFWTTEGLGMMEMMEMMETRPVKLGSCQVHLTFNVSLLCSRDFSSFNIDAMFMWRVRLGGHTAGVRVRSRFRSRWVWSLMDPSTQRGRPAGREIQFLVFSLSSCWRNYQLSTGKGSTQQRLTRTEFTEENVCECWQLKIMV